ncbi:MAG TPA: hypothetical protein VFZ66_23835 [Herpetosiphonaceae bacterium]
MKDSQVLHDVLAGTDNPTLPRHDTLPSSSFPPQPQIDDETYLKIWEIEQGHTNTRWTVATFFLSVSFAIFGFSFQEQLRQPLPHVARLSGLIIYWFAYLVFSRFNIYTDFLRTYLRELEAAQRTTLDIQTRARALMRGGSRRRLSATRLLFYFGMVYAGGVGTLWWLGW